jgi:hypothetical protein
MDFVDRPGPGQTGATELCWQARETLMEQALDWHTLPFVERQWMLREFRQRAGMPVDPCLETLGRLERGLVADPAGVEPASLDKLAAFYDHLGDLALGYLQDPAWREDELRRVGRWAADVRRLADVLEPADLVLAR